jgi:Mg2+-importing ATPase
VHELIDLATCAPEQAFAVLRARPEGPSPKESAARLRTFGPNRISRERQAPVVVELWGRLKNPLNWLLLALAAASWALSDARSAIVILVMVVLSVALGFIQEHRSSAAAARLAGMVRVHATVRRPGAPGADAEGYVETPLDELAPGDVVKLAAGALIPADLASTGRSWRVSC